MYTTIDGSMVLPVGVCTRQCQSNDFQVGLRFYLVFNFFHFNKEMQRCTLYHFTSVYMISGRIGGGGGWEGVRGVGGGRKNLSIALQVIRGSSSRTLPSPGDVVPLSVKLLHHRTQNSSMKITFQNIHMKMKISKMVDHLLWSLEHINDQTGTHSGDRSFSPHCS